MTQEEVKDYIGKENWKKFLKWIEHQTVGIYPDGSTDFYDEDVEAFKRKLDSGYDRQESVNWD